MPVSVVGMSVFVFDTGRAMHWSCHDTGRAIAVSPGATHTDIHLC